VARRHHSLAPAASPTGILVFEAGSGLVVNNNAVSGNDDNIALFTVTGVLVHQNLAQDSTFYDGLFADKRHL
jgi:hypothetical protein